jgi:predicted esterase
VGAALDTHTIVVRTHGRYLVERPNGDGPWPILAGFHGYGETAEHMLEVLRQITDKRLLVSIQALHRFYTKRDEVVANWMTRQDRELEIADNVDYVSSVIAAVRNDHTAGGPLVYVGFSQGVAVAYRAAALGVPPCGGLIVLAGDVPPDIHPRLSRLPPVLIGRGRKDDWYTDAKAMADRDVLRGAGIPVTEHVFDAGHVWDPSFVERAKMFLDERTA